MFKKKQIGEYSLYLSQLLGRGSYGSVFQGMKDSTKEAVAIKSISKDKVDTDQYIRLSLSREIKILRTIISQHTVDFYEVIESPNNYYIVLELCDEDLSKIIKPGKQLLESNCIQILTQICSGFTELVRKDIIHRDLKPANILRRKNIFKISDFGFSKQLFNPSKVPIQEITTNSEVGTCQYIPIEALESDKYSSKCDIWALGLIFYEMLHGKLPWKGKSKYELMENIKKIPLNIECRDLAPNTIDFLNKCLKAREKDRISWNQLFDHPIFSGHFKDRNDENKEFQNKMKCIMSKLRTYFYRHPINIILYITECNYKSNAKDLTYGQYFQFLRAINPNISFHEAKYIFNRTDVDSSGTISVTQILKMIKKYGIQYDAVPSNFSMTRMSATAKEKLENFFIRLKKIIVRNGLSLRRVFNDFDTNDIKGQLSFEEFKYMVQKISKDITIEEAQMAFNLIDEDHSNSIEFEQICKYYLLFNGLVEGKRI